MKKKRSKPILPFALSLLLSSCSSSLISSSVMEKESEPLGVESSGSTIISNEDFAPKDYDLVWSDEFIGNGLNPSNWEYQIGNGSGGWGNNEAQYYTDHNDLVENGTLKIFGKREETVETREVRGKQESVTYQYTSTRIRTYHKVSTTYGYICARIKLSAVQGLWPAFWMLPEEGYGNEGVTWWPTSGEIDIMENQGRVSTHISSALHYASNGNGGSHAYQSHTVEVGSTEEFHVYAILWTKDSIEWLVDGESFFSLSKSVWNRGYGVSDDSPFNRPFHVLLNMAIGGDFDNGKEPPKDWTSSIMEVDYVRIYNLA